MARLRRQERRAPLSRGTSGAGGSWQRRQWSEETRARAGRGAGGSGARAACGRRGSGYGESLPPAAVAARARARRRLRHPRRRWQSHADTLPHSPGCAFSAGRLAGRARGPMPASALRAEPLLPGPPFCMCAPLLVLPFRSESARRCSAPAAPSRVQVGCISQGTRARSAGPAARPMSEGAPRGARAPAARAI